MYINLPTYFPGNKKPFQNRYHGCVQISTEEILSLRLICGTGCFLRHVRWRGVNVLCTIFINENIKRYCHLCVSKDWPINRSIEILRKDLICWRVDIHVMYRTVCMHFAHNINLHCTKDILDWPGLASIDLWKNWESLIMF